MNDRLYAMLLVMMFALSTFLITIPTNASFTIGRPIGTAPYYMRDSNPHVPGPTGYVWPGSGVVTLPTGSGAPSDVTWTQGADLPIGAILASTEDHDNVGDLIFGISFTSDGLTQAQQALDYLYTSLTIYIPPEFKPPVNWQSADTSNIITTITNDYGAIYVWKADVKDPFGPGWWVIYINLYAYLPRPSSVATNGVNPRGILFSESNSYNEWYYVRVNGMKAPKIAGKYVFKMFLDDSFPTTSAVNDGGENQNTILSTMPAENWPVLLVKGEVDPGIIEGNVRCGSSNTQLYGQALQLPGCVRAVGIADDPYTGASTGRKVEARGYFNSSAKGHYEIEGVAPGVYDIYASAAGYPEMKVISGVKVLPEKSYQIDFLLNPGPIITGAIYSKHSFGDVAWPSTRPITVEIYDSNIWPSAKSGYDWSSEGLKFEVGSNQVWTDQGYRVVDAHLKSFSPINLTDSPFTSYVTGNVIYDPATGYTSLLPLTSTVPVGTTPVNVTGGQPRKISFSWEGPFGIPAVSWVNSPGTTDANPKDPFGLFNGVGPAQYWWVDRLGRWTNGGGSNNFRYQFGIKGFYGVPTEFDGHVPQVYATWINGLTAGTYYIRVWINGYVQTAVTGGYADYPFTVAAGEWAGDINTPIDLVTSSWINETVHFHDLPATLETSPMKGPDPWRYMIAEAYDSNNVLVAMNFTQVPSNATDWNITLNGFGMTGPVYVGDTPSQLSGGYVQGVPPGMKFSLYRYRHMRDYGIMPGTYTIRVYMRGYIQQDFEAATISLSSSPAIISNHMSRGAGINVTLYSIDWQNPQVEKPWIFGGNPGDDVRVYIYNKDTTANMGYIRYYDRTTNAWAPVTQRLGSTTIPDMNWGPDRTKLKYNGSWTLERYGPDAEGFLKGDYWTSVALSVGTGNSFVAGLDGTLGKTDAQTGIWLEFGWDSYGFLANPNSYRTKDLKTRVALDIGTYELKAYTLGYVQPKPITVYVARGVQTDTKINIAIGVNITVSVIFKKEGIFTALPYDSSVRIRIFDDTGNLVAAWDSSLYDRLSFYNGIINKGGVAYGGYGTGPNAVPPSFEARNWVLQGTTKLEVLLAGNYYYNEINQPSGFVPREDRMGLLYGIDGWPNYKGNLHAEVDVVNLHYSGKSFPAPPGLLLGESYHMINGVEGSYNGIWKRNHLGPWDQKMVVTVSKVQLGAEASVVFELDQRGLVSGQIAAFASSDELRPVSWATITASSANETFTAYSWDGYYDMYLPAGLYKFAVYEWSPYNEGHQTKSTTMTVSTGQTLNGYSFYLERSKIPVPEFLPIITLVAALGTSMYVLRRTRKKCLQLPRVK